MEKKLEFICGREEEVLPNRPATRFGIPSLTFNRKEKTAVLAIVDVRRWLVSDPMFGKVGSDRIKVTTDSISGCAFYTWAGTKDFHEKLHWNAKG